MIKPFHELTAEEFKTLVEAKMTWGELEEKYPQPEWCNYPEATRGLMGCWSLISHLVTGRDFCKNCDCSKDYKEEPAKQRESGNA